jgi:hypothetical protein
MATLFSLKYEYEETTGKTLMLLLAFSGASGHRLDLIPTFGNNEGRM